jgi:hypothetical protein
MKLRNWAAALGVVALTFTGGGVAAAHDNQHPNPTENAAQRAEAGLLAACKGQGFTALYTPIDFPFLPPTEDRTDTPQDDRDADAFTFVSREQCRATVRAGLPVGLLARAPAGLVTTPAPANFPNPPAGGPVTPLVPTLTTEAVTDNPGDFAFTVRGVNFAPNADVSVLVATRDGRADQRLVGKTDANGVFIYRLLGGCDNTQAVVNVSAFQFTANRAAQVMPPAGVCS